MAAMAWEDAGRLAFQNMQLLGLDDADAGRSLFTCVKELFENAVDACQQGQAHPHLLAEYAPIIHNIEVAVMVTAAPNVYEVRVVDTGCGFGEERLASVGALYSSSKAKGLRASATMAAGGLDLSTDFVDASAGVFGVGLNAVLLWAHLHGGKPVTFMSCAAATDSEDEDDDDATPNLLALEVSLRREERADGRAALSRSTRARHEQRVTWSGTAVFCELAGAAGAFEQLERYFECVAALCVGVPLRVTLKLPRRDDEGGGAACGEADEGSGGGEGAAARVLEIPAMPLDRMWLGTEPVPPLEGALEQLRLQASRFGSDLLTTHGSA